MTCTFSKKASFHIYADDNTSSAYSSELNPLIEILIEEFQTTINWLKAYHIIVNPKKFQAILVSKRKNTISEDLTININKVDIKPNDSFSSTLRNCFRQQTKF